MVDAPSIAFYAPMKSPNHAVPSGDREIARLLTATWQKMGYRVDLASELSSFDKKGDAGFQAACFERAEGEAARLLDGFARADKTPTLWLTYHNYYKAPDLLGPAISKALGIAYVVVEGTRAKKRLTGPWARFAEAAEAGLDHASTIFSFTEEDERALITHRPAAQDLHRLAPYIDHAPIKPAALSHNLPLKILTVAMMRAGAKMESYKVLAEIMADVVDLADGDDHPFAWTIVGDGPCRAQVETLVRITGAPVTFTGATEDRQALNALYRTHHAFLWPGVDEAVGMVYLEAQAHGLPTLAHDYPGPKSTLVNPDFIVPRGDRTAIPAALLRLAQSPPFLKAQSALARRETQKRHSMEAAMASFRKALP